MRVAKKIFSVLRILGVFVLLGWVIYVFSRHFNELKENIYSFDPVKAGWAFLLGIVGTVNYAFLWSLITKHLNCSLGTGRDVLAWSMSEAGKYIPGKVFVLLGKIYFYNHEGIPKTKVLICFYLETIFVTLGHIIVGLIFFSFFSERFFPDHGRYLLLLLPCLFLCLQPRLLNLALKLVFRLFNREPPEIIHIKQLALVFFSVLYTLNTYLFGAALYLMVDSIYSLPLSSIIYLTGIFGLASSLAKFALLAPSGIGVRETIIVILLKSFVPISLASFTALIQRVITSGAEGVIFLLTFGIYTFVLKKKKIIRSKSKVNQIKNSVPGRPQRFL